MGERPQLKKSYDTVIVGGGLHGLATAYYLGTRHGITEVAIIEKNILVPEYGYCPCQSADPGKCASILGST